MQRLKELDSLRGIAACGVAFFFHQSTITGDYGGGAFSNVLWPLYEYGWVCVDLFFVLSGFVFCHVYGVSLERDVGPREFFTARVSRIYPLHLATLLGCALFAGSSAAFRNDSYHFALNLLMLQGSGLDRGMSFNFPSWTLTIEFACYIAFYLLARRGLLIPAAILAVPVMSTLSIVADEDLIRYARGFSGFFSGCLIYRFGWRAVGPLALLGLGIMSRANEGVVAALIAFPALVLSARHFAFLKARALVWLGDLSLSIYLLHIPVYFTFWNLGLRGYAFLPLAIGVVLLASHLSFRYFETPMRIAIRNYPLCKTADGAVKLDV